jgi:predicted O-methyltransferase YrrM
VSSVFFLHELRRYWWFLQEVYPKEWEHYQEEIERFAQRYPEHFRRDDALRWFPAWQHSIDTKRATFLKRCPWTAYTLSRMWPAARRWLERPRNPLADQRPWLTFEAIRFLMRILRRSMRVYEYGSGGSTLFFAQRVGEVVSVEHNPLWFDTLQQYIQAHGYTNSQLHLIEPEPASTIAEDADPADPYAYQSSGKNYHGYSFQAYAASIDAYADATFDLVVVDGRARPACFRHALPKVKPGGYIVWDNTDRPHYAQGMGLAAEAFPLFDFPGPAPYIRSFTRTSIWRCLK